MKQVVLCCLATCLYASNVITGVDEVFQLVAAYTGIHTIPVLRVVSKDQLHLLSPE